MPVSVILLIFCTDKLFHVVGRFFLSLVSWGFYLFCVDAFSCHTLPFCHLWLFGSLYYQVQVLKRTLHRLSRQLMFIDERNIYTIIYVFVVDVDSWKEHIYEYRNVNFLVMVFGETFISCDCLMISRHLAEKMCWKQMGVTPSNPRSGSPTTDTGCSHCGQWADLRTSWHRWGTCTRWQQHFYSTWFFVVVDS